MLNGFFLPHIGLCIVLWTTFASSKLGLNCFENKGCSCKGKPNA